METLEQLLPKMDHLQKESANNTNIQYSLDILEGKKESIDGARVSAETVMKDNRIKETLGRIFGGMLGLLVLFGSITNVIQDFKTKKRSPWVYSRIIIDFVASGALIGYALEQTLWGLIAGFGIGIITMLVEIRFR
jgi:hypothetical protein